MDELLYIIALVVAIGGAFTFFNYGKSKKIGFARIMRKQDIRKKKE
ncbi:hypothetical protein [Metabacillus endolithicus]|uniref:Uncharacterized protein n=1 Tax=Metabacillus endolithicus TaxID=1535204 RepID=A0ABW5C5K3_9BACI|nr:hypothetical protein [Metabacillus endolithicus]UPG66125.1 hypothetical protein MVE64_27190 [Metabacillus endolithicus]